MKDRSTPEAPETSSRASRAESVARALRERILSRQLEPGDRLPTFSQMRSEFGIATNTSDRVYSLLAQEGFVERRVGSGIYVAVPPKDVAAGLIGFVTTGATHLIGVPYWMTLLEGARGAAARAQRSLVLLDEHSNLAALQQVDGFLETTGPYRAASPCRTKPSIALLYPVEDRMSVVADEPEGMRLIVQHLLYLGHRRIAYLHAQGDPLALPRTGMSRVEAFEAAMREAGILVPPDWMRSLHNEDEHGRPLGSFDDKADFEMRRWLDQGWSKLGCTAVICQNDNSAVGVMRALQRAGSNVPGDVSVVGFDGTETSHLCSPSLTTVEMPLAKIAERGMEILLAGLQGEKSRFPAGGIEKLPVQLRVRASSGPVPGYAR